MNVKQGNLTVAEYEKEFSRPSKYALELVLTKTFRCRQFEDGLKESIKWYLMVVIITSSEFLSTGASGYEN